MNLYNTIKELFSKVKDRELYTVVITKTDLVEITAEFTDPLSVLVPMLDKLGQYGGSIHSKTNNTIYFFKPRDIVKIVIT